MPAGETVVLLGAAALTGALSGAVSSYVTAASERHRIAAEDRRLREERGAQRFDQRRAVYKTIIHTSSRLIDGHAHWGESERDVSSPNSRSKSAAWW
jgi:hypothetical protein